MKIRLSYPMNNSCQKCGNSKKIVKKFHKVGKGPKGTLKINEYIIGPAYIPIRNTESILCKCTKCGYIWNEFPVDANIPKIFRLYHKSKKRGVPIAKY